MQISVVIPTCNRKARLLSLLHCLDQSAYPLAEVIIVDASDEKLLPGDYAVYSRLHIRYVRSEPSVCIQRNKGIQLAQSAWIFLCDDDIEVSSDYIEKLVGYIAQHPEAGAVSGLWLEKQEKEWEATHPIRSARVLWGKYIFQSGIWGEIAVPHNDFFTRQIKQYYQRRGNHISKAGWPVNTNFTGDHIICPVYSLGASLVRKDWLLHSPYDEVLDRYGLGDNYGVAVGFPMWGIHVVTGAIVYHHHEPANRLTASQQYYRRVLALHYFTKTKPALAFVSTWRVAWSLLGHLPACIWSRNGAMCKATIKAIIRIVFNKNPYLRAGKEGRKTVEPRL